MDLKQHIGLIVRAARRRRGLTQEQLAEGIGKTVETISNIERGHALTGLETLMRISNFLQAPLRDFFEGFQPSRRVHKARLEHEFRIQRLIESLPDREIGMATEIIEAVIRHRRR